CVPSRTNTAASAPIATASEYQPSTLGPYARAQSTTNTKPAIWPTSSPMPSTAVLVRICRSVRNAVLTLDRRNEAAMLPAWIPGQHVRELRDRDARAGRVAREDVVEPPSHGGRTGLGPNQHVEPARAGWHDP